MTLEERVRELEAQILVIQKRMASLDKERRASALPSLPRTWTTRG